MAENTGTSHGLGFGEGSLIDYNDGTVEYRKGFTLLPAFRVAVADITGFSVRRPTKEDRHNLAAKPLGQVLTIQGSGTTLAEVAVNLGTAERIEAWFRKHPRFGAAQVPSGVPVDSVEQPGKFVDELVQLARLRDAGALTPEEFEQAKRKLLRQ